MPWLLAEAKHITRRIVVANKVDGEEDLGVIRESLGVEPDIVIPKDGAVLAADRAGASPIDHDPGSPGMGKLRELAVLLLA